MGLKEFAAIITDRIRAPFGGSYISTGPKHDAYSIGTESGARRSLDDLEKMYRKNSLAFTGINIMSSAIFGKGWFLECADPGAKELAKKTLDMASFRPTAELAANHTLIYGDGFQNPIWSEKGQDIEEFGVFDPKTLDHKCDKFGHVYEWDQKLNGEIKNTFMLMETIEHENGDIVATGMSPKPNVVHYRFFRVADSVRGIGLLEPIMTDLEVYEDIKISIRETFWRFAHKHYHIKVKNARSKTEIDEADKLFDDFHRSTKITTGDNIDIGLIEGGAKTPNLSAYISIVIDNISAGLRVPQPFLFGRGEDTTRATTFALMDQSQFEITLMQSKLTETWERQILNPLMKANKYNVVPDVRWNRLSFKEDKEMMMVVGKYATSLAAAVTGQFMEPKQASELMKEYIEIKRSMIAGER